MNERVIIQACIEKVAERKGDMDNRAEREAMSDRYIAAGEFQSLAKGIGMAIEVLEEMKKEAR